MADHPILTLATDLYYNRLAQSDLPEVTASLPALDEQTVHSLVQEADHQSRTNPRLGWAIMKVMDAAASHSTPNPLLQAQIAWHLARHTNEYGRFSEVQEPLTRARNIFAAHNLSGWLALCTWQENWLAWTSSNLAQGLSQMQQALTELEQAGSFFAPYIPQCQLSLAAFHLMAGDPHSAISNINASEEAFRANEDDFNLGRSLSAQISIARSTKNSEQAMRYLQEANNLVAGWPGEKAKINLALGYLQWINQGDYAGAFATFTEILHTFDSLDMPIWSAQAQDGLAQLHIATGNLREAGPLLQQALHQASLHRATGLQIAVLLDMGWYETQRGRPEQALAALQSAAQLSEQAGSVSLRSVILMHMGDACIQLGRYQLALRHLEKSHDQFKQRTNDSRLAECELRLAQTWLALGQAQMAQRYLNQARDHALQASHLTILPYYYYRSAFTSLAQNQPDLTLTTLEEGLQVAQQQNDPHSLALMQRSLATLLLSQNKPAEAFTHLSAATTSFRAMGMIYEEIDCLIPWGNYHSLMGDDDQARQVWEQALEQSLDLMPDISWLAAAGLARLAEKRRDPFTALKHYHQMREALRQIRQGFWQPELVSHFNNRPAASLDRAVHLAVRVGTTRDVLAFIEENKAQMITRQMIQHTLPTNPSSVELQTQLGEIRWLQEKLRTTSSSQHILRSSNPLQQQLKTLIERYTDDRSRWQRTETEEQEKFEGISFDQDQFRHKASAVLGEDWIGLDYYLTEQQVQAVVITPHGSYSWAKKITVRAERALLDMKRYGWEAEEDEDFSPLEVLGQFLFPESVVRQLKPTTTVMIAPHRQLHLVPWAALQVGGKPLVAQCIPTLTLSLTNLLAIWSRPRTHPSPLTSGLLLAVSTFPDYRHAIPDVAAECALVRPLLGPEGADLCENEATWDNFLTLHGERDLSRFSFWHVATHASHEPLTGRLSGISFYDRDVWLDELWQCSPLPQLVTLSACSGSKSKVYEGDEHVSLATTCLSAGARTVVGSLWPVADKTMPALMATYYAALAADQSVALALASAQRQAWQQGKSWRLWGGLTCTGAP